MSKLSLIIADNNPSFIDIFVAYLGNQHSHRFQVYCYSDKEKLEEFFIRNEKELDILLVSPELYYEGLESEKIRTLIILSNGRLSKDFGKVHLLNRFQPGDVLVSSLLKFFSENNSDLFETPSENNATRVVGVYSPVGGSGKSCIAIASAITSAQMGDHVFYLNLESAPSTQTFFDCEGESNLSHIFYLLKSKKSNLGLKIEALKILDRIYNVNYFSEQENLLEQTELLPEEFESLILQMRNLQVYDTIFVDLPSIVDCKTLRILAACDEIFFVLSQDCISYVKAQLFYKDLPLIKQKFGIDISSKLTPLLNKCKKDTTSANDTGDFGGSSVAFKIPMVQELLSMVAGKAKINLNNEFGDAIRSLMQRYSKDGGQYEL